MTVHCPHCSTGYLLPDHLLGPRGARVRCPQCKRPFVVLHEGVGSSASTEAGARAAAGTSGAATAASAKAAATVASPPATAASPSSPPTPVEWGGAGPSADTEASRIATELLDALSGRLGGAWIQARDRGRVLAEFGPEVMKAFDDYRLRLGARATPAAFRVALKTRWGVDLVSGLEAGGE